MLPESSIFVFVIVNHTASDRQRDRQCSALCL